MNHIARVMATIAFAFAITSIMALAQKSAVGALRSVPPRMLGQFTAASGALQPSAGTWIAAQASAFSGMGDTVDAPLDTATRYVGSYRTPDDSIVVAKMLADAYAIPRIHRDSALGMAQAAVAIVERATRDGLHADLAEAWHWVGRHSLSLGRFREAETAFRTELAIWERLVGADHPRRASAMDYIARSLRSSGHSQSAIPFYRGSLAIRTRLADGRDEVDLAGSMNNLALALVATGEHNEAATLYRQALAMKRRLYPAGHVDLATTINNLGLLELERGNVLASIALLDEGVAMLRRDAEHQDPVLPAGIAALTRALDAAGRYDTARSLAREVRERRGEIYAGDHPAIASADAQLGRLLWIGGDRASGERLLRGAIEMHRRLTPDGSQTMASSMFELGVLLRKSGDFDSADTLVIGALALRLSLLGDRHLGVASALIERANIEATRDRRDSLAAWLDQAQSIIEGSGVGTHPIRVEITRARARAASASGDFTEVIVWLRRAEIILLALFPDGHPDLDAVLTDLATALDAAGRTSEARAVRARIEGSAR